jgi:hypothetical protein
MARMISERETTTGYQIKVHYRGWNVRYDTYLSMDRLRVCNREESPNDGDQLNQQPVSV